MPDFSPTAIKKRATHGAFLKRQFFAEPPKLTPQDVDLSGKTAIITGSNTGIGFESCKQLIELNLSKLIIAVRSVSKGQEAKERILKEKGKTKCEIEVKKLDLSSYDSIIEFVEYTKTLDRVDIVINNAAVNKRNFVLDPATGHEETIQVNYLGNALFALLILPVMQAKNTPESPGCLSFVNSETGSWAKFKEQTSTPILPAFDNQASFDFQDRYPTSKLLGQLFLKELVKRVPDSTVIVNCSNPGLCKTSLAREFTGLLGIAAFILHALVARTAEVGGRAITDAAVNHGKESHGEYIEDGEVVPSAPFIYTDQGKKVAEQLWQETLDELAFAGVKDILSNLGK
ncbi:hypothetical protein BJY04DRAFT_216156 [Aspergillus karnatakaensis]|uniref:uncharacterized protein n=1 Tax=Aspergillus karnatakaensis TaxID=1810916 RepID=UPI003CCCA7B0